ncbi:MAG TPA: DUF167 domain-containing protein [Candidatus Paceibacterota bacterium]|nr:DUF167 domain-containing protein [Candidatus Paceibacterota bacterium]HMO83103.1 DUF167 domain-containing protein [Candidatus Paceibacterota bacterium]
MYLKVVAYPSAKKEIVTKKKENIYEIRVKEPAERNLANQRIKELLSQKFFVTPKTIKLISGHHSSRKICSLPERHNS